jgi:hypothetical protein
MMSRATDGFDPIGIVVDWLDALKDRRLKDLLALYADDATAACCDGGASVGHRELEDYWRPRLDDAVNGAFEIIALMPEEDGIWLDYRSYRGEVVRTVFRFREDGKILSTTCDEVKLAA